MQAWFLVLLIGSCSTSALPQRGARKDYMQGPSGLRLLVEENHDLPLVRLTLCLRTGGAEDEVALDGLANFTTELMARGAAGKSRADLDAAFDQLGATLGIHTDYDGVHFEVTALSEHIDAAAALLADIVLHPTFPPDEGAKLRREVIAQLDDLRDDDASLAKRVLARRLFGNHPYGRTLTGTESTIPKLTIEKARAWHHRAVCGPGVVIGIAGDINPSGAHALVNRHFADLPTSETQFSQAYAFPHARVKTRITIVDKPERTQSQILFAHVAPNWNDDDFDGLEVAVHSFGGMFSSPLNEEVRGKRGLSYGASARLGKGRGPRAVTLGIAPALAQTAEALLLVRKLFDDFARDGLSDEKLLLGRSNLAESFAFSMATPEDRLDLRLSAELAGLPDDYVDRFYTRISSVTPTKARKAVARHLRSGDLEIVIVATASELRPRLEAAGCLQEAIVEEIAYDRDAP